MTLENLPDDLVIEILKCLPVKSIVRYKAVCRTWLKWLTSPSFIFIHLNFTKASKPSFVMQLEPEGWCNSCDYSFVYDDKPLTQFSTNLDINRFSRGKLVGTCNGILCIEEHSSTLLCNPATKQVKYIDWLINPTTDKTRHGFWQGIPKFGIGFGSSNVLDLKVVRIQPVHELDLENRMSKWSHKVQLFTLSSNRCTPIDWRFDQISFQPNQFLNMFIANSCHWYATDGGGRRGRDGLILSFDMNSNSFKRMSIPTDVVTTTSSCSVGVFWEHLAFLTWTIVAYTCPRTLDIWVMKEYGNVESWTKLVKLGPFFGEQYPTWFDNRALLLQPDFRHVSYNADTHEIEPRLEPNTNILHRIGSVGFYHESLLSIE